MFRPRVITVSGQGRQPNQVYTLILPEHPQTPLADQGCKYITDNHTV